MSRVRNSFLGLLCVTCLGEGPGYEPACLNANLKQMGSAMMVENPISSACHGFEILMPDTLIA